MMNGLGDILPHALKKLGLSQGFHSQMVIIKWQEMVGEEIAAHAQPRRIQQGVLLVGTTNPMWAHHLMTMKAEIINKVNNYFAEKVLKDITFTAGYLKREKNEEPKDIHELPAATHILLSHEEVAQIEELVTTISDETLKDKFRKIIRKDAALKRVKHNQGWVKCNTCGVLCPPGEIICTICKLDKKEEHKNKLRQLIKQVPWLTYKECCQYADCVISDYSTIKEELKDALLREIVAGKNERIACATLLMLHHNLQPEALSEEKISELLNRIRGKKNVSAFRF